MLASPAAMHSHAVNQFSTSHINTSGEFQIRKEGEGHRLIIDWRLHAGMAVTWQSRQKWLFLLSHCVNVKTKDAFQVSTEYDLQHVAPLRLQQLRSAHSFGLSGSSGRVRCYSHVKMSMLQQKSCLRSRGRNNVDELGIVDMVSNERKQLYWVWYGRACLKPIFAACITLYISTEIRSLWVHVVQESFGFT